MTLGCGWSESLSLCGSLVSFIVCDGMELIARRVLDAVIDIDIGLIVVSGTA